MDIRLYYTPGTRSLRPRWLLEELELAYQLRAVDLFHGEGQSEQYLSINPLGAVPAIDIDGHVMLESGAMCHWLADRFIDKGLAPAMDSSMRQRYEQWMFFAPGTLEPPVFYSILHTKVLPEQQRIGEIVPWLIERYQKTLKVVNDKLGGNEYLLGEQFSAADIMLGSTLMWSPGALEDYAVLDDYVKRLKQRPAYLRATA